MQNIKVHPCANGEQRIGLAYDESDNSVVIFDSPMGGMALGYAYIPVVDAVPVVRCKNCKHSDVWEFFGRTVIECKHFEKQIEFDDYCSYGEKRK